MKLTKRQLRGIISEEMFNLAAHGAARKVAPGGGDRWKHVKADAAMAAGALQHVQDAILDDDEELAAKWIQKAEKFTKSAYDSLIGEGTLHEETIAQAQVSGPLVNFVAHLNMAKADLGEVFQQITDQKGSDQAQSLLANINNMIKALNRMPELTRDPWHGARG